MAMGMESALSLQVLNSLRGEIETLRETVVSHEAQIAGMHEWRRYLDKRLNTIEEKLNSINNWLRGLMGSAIISLALLVLDLLRKHV